MLDRAINKYLIKVMNFTNKLRRQVKRYYSNLSMKLGFSSVKLGYLLSLRNSVSYEFTSAGCNASYIGEKTRHASTRVQREHLSSDLQIASV